MPSFGRDLEQTLHRALEYAHKRYHEFATVEHLLLALTEDPHAAKVMVACAVDLPVLRSSLTDYLDKELADISLQKLKRKRKKTEEDRRRLAEFETGGPSPTDVFQRVVQRSILHVQSSGREEVTGANVLVALFSERESNAVYFLHQQDMSRLDAVSYISHGVGKMERRIESPEPMTVAVDTATSDKISTTLNRMFRDDLKPVFDTITSEPVLNTPRIADKIVEFTLDIVEQAALTKSSRPEGRRPLLTIGLYGPWGSGKSTLLRRIGTRMAEERFVSVFVNTWKWDSEEDIFSFMNRELLRSLTRTRGMRGRARLMQGILWIRQNSKRWIGWLSVGAGVSAALVSVDWYKAVTAVDVTRSSLLALATGAFVAAFAKPVGTLIERIILREPEDIDARQSLSHSYRYLELIRRVTYQSNRAPIVFLFDDVDRCDDAKVVEFIKSIHSLTSDGSICILACDDRFAGAAIYSQFKQVADYLGEGQDFGTRFLEKIIQLPFRLPEVTSNDLVALGLKPSDKGQERQGSGPAAAVHPPVASSPSPAQIGSFRGPDTAPAEETISEAKLSEICGSALALVVEPARLQIRQAKMLYNLVKLYSMIFPPVDEDAARRLAAFLIVSYVDSQWIPAKYFSPTGKVPASPLDPVEPELRIMLGEDKDAIEKLYRLFGIRRPAARTS